LPVEGERQNARSLITGSRVDAVSTSPRDKENHSRPAVKRVIAHTPNNASLPGITNRSGRHLVASQLVRPFARLTSVQWARAALIVSPCIADRSSLPPAH